MSSENPQGSPKARQLAPTVDVTELQADVIPVNPELKTQVDTVREYFSHQFGVEINADGNLDTEPTSEQLVLLKDWHEATSAAPAKTDRAQATHTAIRRSWCNRASS